MRSAWSRRSVRLAATALATLVVLPASWLVHYVYFDRSRLPDLEPFLRFEPPRIGEVTDARGKVLIELAHEYRRVVSYDEVLLVLRQAVLAAEGKNSFSHSGVDYGALPRVIRTTTVRSLNAWWNGARLQLLLPQGGSTLTQQLVRAYFLRVIQGSVVALRNADAGILAEAGGRKTYEDRDTRYSDLNRATGSLRQPGSAWKPTVREIRSAELSLIQEGLRGVVRLPDGTAHSLDRGDFPIPVMGKTGTTSNFRDALFVGSTYGPQGITVAVRIDFDDNRELGEKETGGRAALPIFREIMLRIYKGKLVGPAPKFPSEIEEGIDKYLALTKDNT